MFLKKIYNDTDTLVDEAMEGNRLLYPSGFSEVIPGTRITIRTPAYRKPQGLVKLVGGGGAGHEGPGAGRVGPGGSDCAVRGDVFAAPSGALIFKGMQAIDDGSPMFVNVTNHTGDVLNFGFACQMAEAKGMKVHMHLSYNDVGSAPKGREKDRRGIGGCYSVTSTMAECGEPIEEIVRLAEKTNEYTRTYGVGIRSAIHPVTGLPIMEMPEDMIELGIGVHGESSGNRVPLPRSRDLAALVVDTILADMPVERGEEICLNLGGLGGLTWMEIYILYKDIYYYLADKGIKLYQARAGNSGTQELGGFILSIARIDDEIKKWIHTKIPEGMYPTH